MVSIKQSFQDLSKEEKKEALANLTNHTGWNVLKNIMLQKQQSLQENLLSCNAGNTAEVSRLQARIKQINEMLRKPKTEFENRLKNK